ncbi:hypothetical protein [Pseudoxanthomonas sp. JBR18]|uniref:hypothetical protein n=1 Tax=Pseudoxanthomonas sp. JBR18 TaxID=2969308 RepID=UPI002305AE74|nr:hypothetical protein [Pseudoxanthomonas sp. JBR18]WCE05501.1 hypothetical protein PJ250_05950 [Pseudoxanthomonas sp. JBR18]
MQAAASSASSSHGPSSGQGRLHAVRLGPGQGGAMLRRLRTRLLDEQGQDPWLEDDALEMSATQVVVLQGQEPVAALRLHAADTPQLRQEMAGLLRLERFAGTWPAASLVVGSRLAVLAEHRVRPVIDALVREAYQLSRDSGVRFGLIMCPPELHALFAFYGFQEYLPPAILPGGSAVLRMVMVCEHAADFRATGSPLLELVQQPEIGASAHAWLAQAFPMLG